MFRFLADMIALVGCFVGLPAILFALSIALGIHP